MTSATYASLHRISPTLNLLDIARPQTCPSFVCEALSAADRKRAANIVVDDRASSLLFFHQTRRQRLGYPEFAASSSATSATESLQPSIDHPGRRVILLSLLLLLLLLLLLSSLPSRTGTWESLSRRSFTPSSSRSYAARNRQPHTHLQPPPHSVPHPTLPSWIPSTGGINPADGRRSRAQILLL
jgi:hypothetical protein